ncbi:MAG: acyl carrier protein [Elusimicrobia bacterium]|nr:acyl carrier protein [Elusimicrobiota bacterium]
MNGPDDVKRKVFAYLETQRPLPGADETEKLRYDYLDTGFVDSVQVVELVMQLEDDLGVRLEPEHLQSEEFRTVGGLIQIIQRLARR